MNRVATALATGEPAGAAARLIGHIRAQLGEERPRLLTLFASTTQPLGEMATLIRAAFPEAVLIGASTAGEFTELGHAKGAVSLFALAGGFHVHAGLGAGLKADPQRAIECAVDGLPIAVNGYPHRTAILLLDPLAGNGEEATLIASSLLGPDVRLVGGAAGDDLAMKRTHVSCGDCVETDAAVVAIIFSKEPLGVGVCHGHGPVSTRPLRVTRSQGNVVHEIDGRPAWRVWQEETREHARAARIDVLTLPTTEEVSYLLRYEAGLASGAHEYKIRAPLYRNADDSISFACGIPEGSVFRITTSNPERQIESAREAARRARAQIGGRPVVGAIVFDCTCRSLILEGDFNRAVRGISDALGDVRLAGFETYGEIALDAGDLGGFHSATTVVLAFPEV
jgi:methyl-accepting chemotaxis protein